MKPEPGSRKRARSQREAEAELEELYLKRKPTKPRFVGMQAHKDAVAAAVEKGKAARIRPTKTRGNSAASSRQPPAQPQANDQFGNFLQMAQAMQAMKDCFGSPAPAPRAPQYYPPQPTPLNMPQVVQGYTPPNYSAAAPPPPPSSQVVPYGQQTMVYGTGAQNGVFYNAPAQS